ncbi:MAG: hypothetical protein ACUVV4_07000 [Candidatus Bathyarchaeia archaeon]
MAFESVQNSNKSSLRGAGIGGAQLLGNKGAEAVLTEAWEEDAACYQDPYQPQIGVEPSTSATKGEEKEALSSELDGLELRLSEVKKRREELKR